MARQGKPGFVSSTRSQPAAFERLPAWLRVALWSIWGGLTAIFIASLFVLPFILLLWFIQLRSAPPVAEATIGAAALTPTSTATPIPTSSPTPPPTKTPTPTATAVPTPFAEVLADVANLYAGPGPNYPVVGQVQRGEMLAVIGRDVSTGWWQVVTPAGLEGWIEASMIAVSHGELVAQVEPPPLPTDTPTLVPATATPTDTPIPPTDTPTSTPVPPTATPTNTPIPPTDTPTPTRTTAPPAPTSTPTPIPFRPTATPSRTPTPATPTRVAVRPVSTRIVAPAAAPDLPSGILTLIAPLSIEEPPTRGPTTFVWEWVGDPLAPKYGFEIRAWLPGEPPLGVHDAVLDNNTGHIEQIGPNRYQLKVGNIRYAKGVLGREGNYFWTVLVVQVNPAYQDFGLQAVPARFRYEPFRNQK